MIPSTTVKARLRTLCVVLAVCSSAGCATAQTTAQPSQQVGSPPDPHELARAYLSGHPSDPVANNALGVMYLEERQFSAALPYLKAAVDLTEAATADPLYVPKSQCPDILAARYINYANALRESGDSQTAFTVIERLSSEHRSFEAWMEVVLAAHAIGNKAIEAQALAHSAQAHGMTLVYAKGKGFGGSDYFYACKKLIDRVWKGENGYVVAGLRRNLHPCPLERDTAGDLDLTLALQAVDLFIALRLPDDALALLKKAEGEIQRSPAYGNPADPSAGTVRSVATAIADKTATAKALLRELAQEHQQSQAAKRVAQQDAELSRPGHWPSFFADGIQELLRMLTEAHGQYKGGFETLARETLWPKIVEAERRLCAGVAQARSHLQQDAMEEVVRESFRRIAYRDGDAEAERITKLLRRYFGASAESCMLQTGAGPNVLARP